jgi:hypothetical protein
VTSNRHSHPAATRILVFETVTHQGLHNPLRQLHGLWQQHCRLRATRRRSASPSDGESPSRRNGDAPERHPPRCSKCWGPRTDSARAIPGEGGLGDKHGESSARFGLPDVDTKAGGRELPSPFRSEVAGRSASVRSEVVQDYAEAWTSERGRRHRLVYDPDGKSTGAGTSWTLAPARRRAGTTAVALAAPSLGPAPRAPNRPAGDPRSSPIPRPAVPAVAPTRGGTPVPRLLGCTKPASACLSKGR